MMVVEVRLFCFTLERVVWKQNKTKKTRPPVKWEIFSKTACENGSVFILRRKENCWISMDLFELSLRLLCSRDLLPFFSCSCCYCCYPCTHLLSRTLLRWAMMSFLNQGVPRFLLTFKPHTLCANLTPLGVPYGFGGVKALNRLRQQESESRNQETRFEIRFPSQKPLGTRTANWFGFGPA